MATGHLVEMLARNKKFAEAYQAPVALQQMALKMRQSRAGVVVLSCSDPRLNPYQILGLDSSLSRVLTVLISYDRDDLLKTIEDATMVRNAGGRVFDAIRTLSVLQTIGAPGTIAVMHHTDCGLTHFHDHKIKKALIEIAPDQKEAIEQAGFGEITGSIEDSLRDDLKLLKASPLILKGTQIVGLKYDIETGILSEVGVDKNEL